MSANRTIVHLVAAHPIAGAELADPGLDLVLQRLKPGELVHPSGQLLEVGDDQRAHRGVTLRGGDPGTAVDVIGNGDRYILHIFTVTRFHSLPGLRHVAAEARSRLQPRRRSPSSMAVYANVGKIRRASDNHTSCPRGSGKQELAAG